MLGSLPSFPFPPPPFLPSFPPFLHFALVPGLGVKGKSMGRVQPNLWAQELRNSQAVLGSHLS